MEGLLSIGVGSSEDEVCEAVVDEKVSGMPPISTVKCNMRGGYFTADLQKLYLQAFHLD